MSAVNRRTVLAAFAFGALAGMARATAAQADTARERFPLERQPAPIGVLTKLPGDGDQLALTVDDGANVNVVASVVQFCRDTGTRLTFFVNGANSSWTVNAPALRPLVDSGQIQLGNHTWSHPYLNRIGLNNVEDQIRRNADFLKTTYGVDGRPYFRPPYGVHSPDTDRVAADLGYTAITMWSSTIGDSRPENEADLVARANGAFQSQQIVLAHANLPTITHCYPQLNAIIESRNLRTVTLNDVFV